MAGLCCWQVLHHLFGSLKPLVKVGKLTGYHLHGSISWSALIDQSAVARGTAADTTDIMISHKECLSARQEIPCLTASDRQANGRRPYLLEQVKCRGWGGGRGWHHWRSTGDLLARRGCLLLCDIKYNVITFWRSNCITISQQVHNVRWAANIINNNQIRICFEQQRQMFPAGFRIKLLLSLNINLNRKKYIKKWHFFWENLFFWFYPDLHWNIKSDSHPH